MSSDTHTQTLPIITTHDVSNTVDTTPRRSSSAQHRTGNKTATKKDVVDDAENEDDTFDQWLTLNTERKQKGERRRGEEILRLLRRASAIEENEEDEDEEEEEEVASYCRYGRQCCCCCCCHYSDGSANLPVAR